MSRQYEAIDLLALYSKGNHKEWNAFLDRALKTHDVEGLRITLYRIQAGMDDLVKKKLTDDKIVLWYVRLQRSIELTVKKVFREKYPSPLDSGKTEAKLALTHSGEFEAHQDAKRKRDHEFELFLKRARY